ncbi:MAG: MBG domain-containing protein [Nocardioides sp.]
MSVASSLTLRAIAYRSDLSDSAVNSAVYTIDLSQVQVSAPAFNPGGGTYTSAQSVAITSATAGATIRYTTDGSTPTATTGTVYSGAVSVSASTVLRAIATLGGAQPSPVTTATYVIQSTSTGSVTLPSTAQEDGWILESASGSGVGGTLNSTDNTTNGLRVGDDAGARQYRSVISFNTSTLPANATITSATLLLRRGALTGSVTNLGSVTVDVSTGGFGGNPALALTDFAVAATAQGVATISVPSANGQIAGGALNAAGLAAINFSGRTQFRLAYTVATNGNTTADFLGLYAADNNVALNWPALQINYAVTSMPVFSGQPASQTVTVGADVSLAAVATGSPTPTYQWFKNGVAIAGATSSTLGLSHVTLADAGSYSVTATNSAGSATSNAATLTVNKAAAVVTLADLSQTYDGSPRVATAVTTPVGLTVDLTYEGSATAPTAAGSYAVVATVNDASYAGTATGTLVVAQATPSLTWTPPADLTFGTALSGAQLSATASTAGSFVYTPAAGTLLPAGSGQELHAVFTPSDAANYVSGGEVSTTINVLPAAAAVTLGNLDQAYDGTPKSVSVATVPAGLAVSVSYNGNAAVPSNVGSYAVAASITDPNYIGAASGTLVIRDVTAPVLALPANAIVEATGPAGAPATFSASATDNVDGAVPVTFSAAPGSVFPLGTTTVTASATDIAGNTATDVFTVTVRDTTAPSLSAPPSLLVEAAGPGGAIVSYTATANDLVSGMVGVSGAPASGNIFPLGVTSVQLAATDAAGNTATGTFTVTVRDTLAPVLSLPANFTVDASSVFGAVVTYSASAADAVGGSVPVTLSPASGSTLPVGNTIVTASATDASGNTATGNFVVTVRAPATALLNRIGSLNGTVVGSVRLSGHEDVTFNGGASLSGELIVPGSPSVRLNGNPTYGGAVDGVGSGTPTDYTITLNGGSNLARLVRRFDALTLPTVVPPATPVGTRNVTLNNASQGVGDFSTLRDLTLNGGVGAVAVPGGTYGSFTANGGAGFILGTAGATTPTIYQFQSLTLNGGATFTVVGPVIVTVKNGFSTNAVMGDTAHADWLDLRVSGGGLTLNGNVTVAAKVTAPSGTVTINGGAKFVGGLTADRLTLNGNGRLEVTIR